MPVCTGTLYWQLDDCWPVTSWSSIDYYGRWKALQYFARRFYEPTHVSAVERSTENGGADIVLTHDSFDELVLAVNWKLLTYNGDEIASGQRQCRVKEPVSGIICNIPFEMYLVEPSLKSAKNPNTRQNSYLSMTVLDAKGNCLSRNVCHFADFKDIDLPKPDLELKVRKNRDGAEITVKTDVFAKWVWLEAEGSDGTGKFSDNYFDMNPGESRVITYKGDNGSGFKVKSLFDTYQ